MVSDDVKEFFRNHSGDSKEAMKSLSKRDAGIEDIF
jgi:hypothetical protein